MISNGRYRLPESLRGMMIFNHRQSTAMLHPLCSARSLLLFSVLIGLIVGHTVRTGRGKTGPKFGYIVNFYIDSARELHCFYENVTVGSTFSVNAQVVSEHQIEVYMHMTSPSKIIDQSFKDIDNVHHEIVAEENGVYKVCFGANIGLERIRLNTHIIAYDTASIHHHLRRENDKLSAEAKINEKIGEIVQKVQRIVFYQSRMSANIRIDELMQQANVQYVTYFSLIQIVVILFVTIGRTISIRRLFATS